MSEIDYEKTGKERFAAFCKTIKKLSVEDGLKFDLVVASGNSGLAVGKFTEMIYEELGLHYPKTLSIPFYRFLPGYHDDQTKLFDSSIYLPEVMDQIKDIQTVQNVLFVDDEIGLGITATSIYRTINIALEKMGKLKFKNFYIVAENQGFKVPEDMPEIKFIPYAQELEGYNNVIFYITPKELEKPIIDSIGNDDVLPFHQRTNILLNLPIKDFNNGNPIYSDKYLELAKEKIPNLVELQNRYEEFLRSSIKSCLSN